MFKKLYITILIALFSFQTTQLFAQEILPELKPSVMVDDSIITLGDLFSDLNEKQDLVVANAPEPGKKLQISADISIKNISVDRGSNKFSALIGAPTGSGGESLHTINGRTISVTMVPSLVRTIRSGDVIKSSDIKWISLADNQVSRNIIRSSDKLVGMTPRNQIKEGSAIRLSDVNRPVLVKRGALVKINFSTSKISLTTLGKAVEKGGKGDVIQVKNNSSNKIISAIVLGPNQVEVHADLSSLVLLNP